MNESTQEKRHIGGLILTRCADDEIVVQTDDGSGCRLRANGYGELEQRLFYVLADAILNQQPHASTQELHPQQLTVWYGSMPESNGKSNFTAILYRKGGNIMDGYTIDRSEYLDRVRYEADRVRYLIGELNDPPSILDYDGGKRSDYVAPEDQRRSTQGVSPLCGKYADVLSPFLALMERELHANSGKGDRPGWLSMSRATAMLEIYYHVSKLQKAVKDGNVEAIREYAADVANMAMMAVDVCGALIVGDQPEAR